MGSGQVDVAQQRLPGAIGRQQSQTRAADPVQQLSNRHSNHDQQVEQRPSRRPNYLGVVDVDTGVADQDGVGPRRIGAADDGAEVAGVANVGQDHQQSGAQPEHHVKIDVNGPTDSQQPLGDQRVAHGREDLVAHLARAQASGQGRLEDGRMPTSRLGVEVEILDHIRAVRDHLAHRLGALGEEETLAFTRSAPAQRPH